MRRLLLAGCVCLAWSADAAAAMPVRLVIATVNNGHMIQLQEFGAEFEKTHPDIRLRWVTLDEQALRRYVGTDLATRGGQFDVITIGLYEAAPVARSSKGSSWLWSWAFAIPASAEGAHAEAARRFVLWATSRDYVALVGARKGWDMVPGGTRTSTYGDVRYRRAAHWGKHEIKAIANADPDDATLPDSPYTGVQFAAIPAFRAIGDEVGELVAQALAGHLSVTEALAQAQRSAKRQMVIDNGTR